MCPAEICRGAFEPGVGASLTLLTENKRGPVGSDMDRQGRGDIKRHKWRNGTASEGRLDYPSKGFRRRRGQQVQRLQIPAQMRLIAAAEHLKRTRGRAGTTGWRTRPTWDCVAVETAEVSTLRLTG